MSTPTWRKSSYSGTGSDCVEVAPVDAGIAMRNSNHPDDGTIVVDPVALGALLGSVKAGEQDHLTA